MIFNGKHVKAIFFVFSAKVKTTKHPALATWSFFFRPAYRLDIFLINVLAAGFIIE